jgi:hypothetical protein
MNKNNWPTKKLGEVTDDEIKKKVEFCIRQLLGNDRDLLEIEVNERSIAHKLAEYLQQQFPKWHVDCEYNRHGIEIKKLGEARVYPDIIVHLRNTPFNLLVIELKCSNKNYEGDIEKLKEFTDKNGEFKYKLGLLLKILDKEIKEMIWFKNGQKQENFT